MRLSGFVVSTHQSKSKYGGDYGEILGSDGKYYVFSAGQVFRNFSVATVGTSVTFRVTDHCYAAAIDQMFKAIPVPVCPTEEPR